MKIKNGFVSNSSSTSFIIITPGEFTFDTFCRLFGVENNSPWFPFFQSLWYAVERKMGPIEEYGKYSRSRGTDWLTSLSADFPEEVIERINKGREDGKQVLFGYLSSDDGDPVEAFFAVESFEIEDETTYFNALECSW